MKRVMTYDYLRVVQYAPVLLTKKDTDEKTKQWNLEWTGHNHQIGFISCSSCLPMVVSYHCFHDEMAMAQIADPLGGGSICTCTGWKYW